jgi:GAF domain-containing protein
MSDLQDADRRGASEELMETLEWPALPQLVSRMLGDEDRRRAVRETELLDAEADEALDRLVGLAAAALHAPKSAVTLLDADRQVYAGRVGIPQREDGMERSYCQYAAAAGRTMAIRDAGADPVLRDHPATRDGVRSYLGVPLLTRDGHALGAVCVFGDTPREWSARDVEVLTDVCRVVTTELELRRTLRRLADGAA